VASVSVGSNQTLAADAGDPAADDHGGDEMTADRRLSLSTSKLFCRSKWNLLLNRL